MGSLDTVSLGILFASLLALAGIMSSLLAMRFGAPLLLVFLAVGFYAGTFFGTGAATSTAPYGATTTGTAAAGDPYANTSTWQINTRSDAGFRIAYPVDFAIQNNTNLAPSTDWRVNGGGESGVKAFSLVVPKTYEPNTNLADSTLTVGYSATQAAQTACLTPDPSGGPATATTTVNVNGTAFSVFSSSDAGAGNLYHTVSYRALHDGKCYAIEYTIHSTQLANYPASYGLTQFDEAKVEALMDRIVNTFSFI